MNPVATVSIKKWTNYEFSLLEITVFATKWVNMSFPDHGDSRKVVDNIENYLYMQCQPKVMTRSQENGQKPHFWNNCL